jgi:hypothetical protein
MTLSIRPLFGAPLLVVAAVIAQVPEGAPARVALKAGDFTVSLNPLDPKSGRYRGTRFNWSGSFHKITLRGHEFVARWQESRDPLHHDNITGPVDEFDNESPPGFATAKAGASFAKIGVGALKRPDAEPYRFARTYELLDGGRWTQDFQASSALFTHELDHPAATYRYTKSITVGAGGKLTIAHELTNRGSAPLVTSHYGHHFFRIDDTPVGAPYELELAYPMTLNDARGRVDLFELKDRTLRLRGDLGSGDYVYSLLPGFGSAINDHRFTLRNTKTGSAIVAIGDRPLTKFQLWGVRTTLCPEPFVRIEVPAGGTERWSTRYRFETK